MPVSTTNAISGPLLTNGVTTTFPFTFTAPSAAEVQVISRNIVSGADTVIASGFSVTLTPGGGGSVVFDAPPASGAHIYLQLAPDFTQDVEFADGSKITAGALNQIADRSVARDQFLLHESQKAIKVIDGEEAAPLPSSSERAGKLLGFDLSGNPVASGPAVPASDPERNVLTLEQFAPTGYSYYNNPGDRGTDWHPVLMQALDAINRYAPVNSRWPRVPRIELPLGAMFFGTQIDLKVAAHFRGQGGGHDDFNGGTRFVFGSGVKGITVNDSDTVNGTNEAPTTSARGTIIEGIQIESEGGGTRFDHTATTTEQLRATAAANTCGLWVRATCTIRDVGIKGWEGNGAQLIAFQGNPGSFRGNLSGTLIERLMIRDVQSHGWLAWGNDSNACLVQDLQVRSAGLMAMWDRDTLGNTYINPRADSFAERTQGFTEFAACNYLGVNYFLIDPTPGIGAATTPGTDSRVWYPQELNTPSDFFQTWNPAREYICMAPMLLSGQSNSSVVVNPYIEGGQRGHAGGTNAEPGCAATIVGGQSQWTNFTRRIYGLPLAGAALASHTGFIARRPSLPGTDEVTNFGAYTETEIGGLAGNLKRYRIDRGGEVNYTERFNSGGDIVFDREGVATLWHIATHLTSRQNGRGAADPYSIAFPGLVLVDPADSGNNRHLTMGTSAPTSGGPYARGERIWNVNPAAGRPDYWECLVTGTPGTWIGRNILPIQSGVASAALTGTTAETVMATIPLPAGTLGPNGSIIIDAVFSATGTAGTKTTRARLGGASGFIFATGSGTATALSGRMTGYSQNRNSVSAQVTSGNSAFGFLTAAIAIGSVDTSVAQDIVITGLLGAAGDSLRLEGYSIRIEPGA